jgi:hypothetical protein
MISRKQRIPFCDLSELDADGRQMAERTTVNGQVLNIFKVLLNHPKLVRNWGRFGNYILQAPLSRRASERSQYCASVGLIRPPTNGNNMS